MDRRRQSCVVSLMRLAALIVLALASSGHASQEQIHNWKAVNIVADTSLFGDVEVKATADAKGNVQSLVVTSNGRTIAIPTSWLRTLPAMRLGSLEVRTEVGYDPKPWLYVVFHVGWTQDLVHIAFQNGKLAHAGLTTVDAKGDKKYEQRKAP